MPRTLTPARRRAMAAARARATEARHTAEDRQLRVWRGWLRDETQAYQELVTARGMFGATSDEADTAYRAWRRVVKRQPTRPPDSAFKRSRGEDSETDSN